MKDHLQKDPVANLSKLEEEIRKMMARIDDSIDTVRRISTELRPSILDDLGLAATIEWRARQFQAQTGIAIQCDHLFDSAELTREQSTAIFRIVQEALTNILRHARATHVEIAMEKRDGALVLKIQDNGRGIAEEDKSHLLQLGLLGMRERAMSIGGEFNIKGVQGRGTVVSVRVPMSVRDDGAGGP